LTIDLRVSLLEGVSGDPFPLIPAWNYTNGGAPSLPLVHCPHAASISGLSEHLEKTSL